LKGFCNPKGGAVFRRRCRGPDPI